ncbi:MAG: hypothetical protein NVSMB18_25910 [Acetobacteraceae bacterium]
MTARDEVADASYATRLPWGVVLGTVARLGPAELAKRAGGVALDTARPGWRGDPIPLLLGAAEFAVLSRGLVQRARLLECLLADLDGGRTIFARGLLPEELAVVDRRGDGSALARVLPSYAADLLRSPDGEWRVSADRIGEAGQDAAPRVRRWLAQAIPDLCGPQPLPPVPVHEEAGGAVPALLEAPVLASFLPRLCRALLGESLLLASLPALWLADDGAVQRVAECVQRWAIRPAIDGAAPPIPLAALAREQRIVLEAAIAAKPRNWVACLTVPPSRAPCLGPDGVVPRPVALRLFLERDGEDWRVSGGIGLVLSPGSHLRAGLEGEALLKDVWVVEDDTPLRRDAEVAEVAPAA